MFTVQYGDLTYKVSFRHQILKSKEDFYQLVNSFLQDRELSDEENKLTGEERSLLAPYIKNNNGKQRFKTSCRIVVSDSSGFEQTFEDESYCNPCDMTQKHIGKKFALNNLLDNCKDELFPRDLREILYLSLFEMFPAAKLSPNCRYRRI